LEEYVDVQEALAELLRVSADVTQAAVLDGNGAVVASTGTASHAAVSSAAENLWQMAQRAAGEAGGGILGQLVVEAGQGATFMVVEAGMRIVAITGRRPASGLVFFDLRACLRDAFDGEASS
jgi:predicted regulator of Ras-like GTPase activity (Roadblock/LC7/MglB family)